MIIGTTAFVAGFKYNVFEAVTAGCVGIIVAIIGGILL
jgi:hypothetical protein